MLQEDQRCRIAEMQPDTMLDGNVWKINVGKIEIYYFIARDVGLGVVSLKLKLVNLVRLEPDRP